MFSKSVALSLLFLALSSLTAQAAPPLDLAKRQAACSAPVTRTVTVSPTATAVPPPANGGGDNNGGNNGGNGNNNNNGGGNAGNGGNNNNGGNNGGNGGNGGGNNGNNDPQTSLTLDPSVIAANFAQDGQAVPVAGQVSSKTSTNNFINFCLTVPDLPITDGKQVQGGSCNPAPTGQIPSVENMPSAKFQFPLNFATIPSTQQFTIQLRVEGFQVGNFVNAQTNYFAAPQQLNGNGQIIGHTHVVIEKLESLAQTTALDPRKFTFFKGVNGAAVNGVVTADVAAGVPVGDYRLCTIQTSANHAPIIGPVAQHGSFDDCIYFTAAAGAGAGAGAGNGGNNGGNGGGNNLVSILPVPTATGAAPGNTASASATSPAAGAGAPGATASAGNTAVQPTGAQPTGGAQQPTGAKPTDAAPTGTGAAPPAAEPTNAAPTGTGAAPPAAEPTKANPPAESPATSAAATVTAPAPGATQTCAAPVSVTVTVTETATATAGAPSAGAPTQSPAATAAPAVPPPAAAPPAAAPGKGNNWGKNKNNKFKNGFKNGFRRW